MYARFVSAVFVLLQTDKKRQVDEAEGRLWADAKGYYYFETSAQTGDGINEMFQVHVLTVCDSSIFNIGMIFKSVVALWRYCVK